MGKIPKRKSSGRSGCAQRSTCRSGQSSRLVTSALRPDGYPFSLGRPVDHALPRVYLGAELLSGLDEADDAALGQQKARVRLIDGLHVRRKAITGKSAPECRCIQDFMRQVMKCAGLHSAPDRRAVCGTGINPARDDEKPLSGEVLELPPQLVGTPQERDVAGVLGISEPDDSAHAMR